MIPEILRYQIPLDETPGFQTAYQKAFALIRQSPNFRGFTFTRSRKDSRTFLIILFWDSEDGHLQGFRRSPLFAPFLDLVRPFMPYLLEMEHYETIAEWRAE